jgi:hypothetical protein
MLLYFVKLIHCIFRDLAKSYSYVHRKMGKGGAKCEEKEKEFKDGITNGANWYSVPGGNYFL